MMITKEVRKLKEAADKVYVEMFISSPQKRLPGVVVKINCQLYFDQIVRR